MNFFATSKRTGALALIGLAACQMPNPAFEDGEADDEVADTNETAADESGSSESADESADESAESGESSSDTTDVADTTDLVDTTDLADTSDDVPDETCNAAFSEPFSVIYGAPEAFDAQMCTAAGDIEHLKVLEAGPVDGLVMAQVCAPGCSSCTDEIIPVGVVGLADFSAPLVDQVQNQELVCIRVQTGPFRGLHEGRCLYDTMWVGSALSNLLVAQHRVAELPPASTLALGNTPPPVPGEIQIHCSCASAYADDDLDGICCEQLMVTPYVSSVAYLDAEFGPSSDTPLAIEGAPWTFHVAQAQSVPNCENNPTVFEMSWALVAQ
jgi:hypothetical protein